MIKIMKKLAFIYEFMSDLIEYSRDFVTKQRVEEFKLMWNKALDDLFPVYFLWIKSYDFTCHITWKTLEETELYMQKYIHV